LIHIQGVSQKFPRGIPWGYDLFSKYLPQKNFKKWYDIGTNIFEREVDPFVDKLLKEYSLDVKKY